MVRMGRSLRENLREKEGKDVKEAREGVGEEANNSKER